MRPVDRGDWPTDASGARVAFARYGEAQPTLIERLGRYGSYCEMRIDNAPAVEHISPKKRDPERERDWDNLLLACACCNGHKGNNPKPPYLHEYCWPDRDNTFLAFRYLESGEVEIDSARSAAEQKLAMRTRAPVKLNQRPRDGEPLEAGDPRWQKRIAVWEIADDCRRELTGRNTETMRELITKIACANGRRSIWMMVFRGDPDMRRRLIGGFRGTATACFDETSEPRKRPGGAI